MLLPAESFSTAHGMARLACLQAWDRDSRLSSKDANFLEGLVHFEDP